MKASSRRLRLPLLIVAAFVGATGCSLSSLPYFLCPEKTMQAPTLVKLASDDKDKEVKVVILAYNSVETRPELLLADHELTELLERNIRETCRDTKEKISVVSTRKVREFKNNHPGWYESELTEIGKHFDVDYVIYLEINSLSLYEQGSHNMLYYGRAHITMQVADMHNPEAGPIKEQYVCQYPTSRMQVSVEDEPLEVFRRKFLNHIAKQLSWYFVPHPMGDEMD